MYLTEEATTSKLKGGRTGESGRQVPGAGPEDGPSYDIWEKRQLKAMTKLRKDLSKMLKSLQLHFDIKTSMLEDEEDGQEMPKTNNVVPNDYETFDDFVARVLIEPYGSRLFQPLHDLATELDLSESLFSQLKKKTQNEGGSLRKHMRKPTTPSKILKTNNGTKKTFDSKKIQTDPISNNNSGNQSLREVQNIHMAVADKRLSS